MGLSGGPNAEKTRKIQQVAIKPENLLKILKEFGIPEDSKVVAMSPVMLLISSDTFEEVPHGEKIPLLEVEYSEDEDFCIGDLGIG